MAINITYNPSTNRIQVTGGTESSPADFQDIVTFDRNGQLELLAATPGANNLTLTRQIRPVELRALRIDFIVADKTAEGDYIHITGTDAWGNVLQETIDVSAGNGTYTTTNYFRTITDIDCNDDSNNVAGTEWADGTVQVIQNMWGIIWNCSANNTYFLDALLRIGDDYISTYFKDLNKVIVFTDVITGTAANLFEVGRYATLQLGELIDEAKKEKCNGCVIHVVRPSSYYSVLFNKFYNWGGTRLLYGCTITSLNHHSRWVYVYCYDTDRFWNCNLVNYPWFYCYGDADLYNVTQMGGSASSKVGYGIWIARASAIPVINDTKFMRPWAAIRVYSSAEARKVVATDNDTAVYIGVSSYSKTTKLIDCIIDNWIVYGSIDALGEVLRQYTVNIHVADKDGNNLSEATVTCKDKDDNTVFSVQTDVNGDIVEQEITYQRWSDLPSGYHGEDEAYCFSPHKFIISKSGYETLELDEITVSEPIKFHFELQDPVAGECDYPEIDDVEEGVQYDSGNKVGIFAVPAQADVRKDTAYGANEEFVGQLEAEGLILSGQNLTGRLETKKEMEGELQKKDEVTGTLVKKDIVTGEIEKKKDITGELEKDTNLTGEK